MIIYQSAAGSRLKESVATFTMPRAPELKHLHGMQPLLMLSVPPGFFPVATQCHNYSGKDATLLLMAGKLILLQGSGRHDI